MDKCSVRYGIYCYTDLYTEGQAIGRTLDIGDLLVTACKKYEEAIHLNSKYSNAFNSWGLALSTHAKVTDNIELSEMLFSQAYEKIEAAIKSRTDTPSIEICNYAMTLIAHAVKREKLHCGGLLLLYAFGDRSHMAV